MYILYIPLLQGGRNALHLAAEGGRVSTLRYLAPKMESLLHSTDCNGFTMLHCAALNGHAKMLQLVIDEYKLDPTACANVSVYWSYRGLP